MIKSRKFSDSDLIRKLTELGWKGRYFSISNKTTYLTDTNDTIAEVVYDNSKSIILSVKFK
jgi:hypothetical protein